MLSVIMPIVICSQSWVFTIDYESLCAECYYAKCCLCLVSGVFILPMSTVMPNIIRLNFLVILSVTMQNNVNPNAACAQFHVIISILNVVRLNGIRLNVFVVVLSFCILILSVIMQNVISQNVVCAQSCILILILSVCYQSKCHYAMCCLCIDLCFLILIQTVFTLKVTSLNAVCAESRILMSILSVVRLNVVGPNVVAPCDDFGSLIRRYSR